MVECSERTVYRILQVVERAHFPVYSESVEGSLTGDRRWKFSRTTALSERVHFESHEILALYLARESLKSMKGSPLIDNILKLTEKLERALGPSVEKELKNLSSYVTYKAQATWQTGVSQETLDTVYRACWDSVVLDVEYKSKSGENIDQIKKRKLGPETLYFANGGAYLIAKDLADDKIKTYSLSRIFSANYTEDEYISKGFDLTEFMKSNFGVLGTGEASDVLIFVADPIGSYVSERRWHDSQQITRVEGGIEFKMHVKVNDELARWVLGLGGHAVVLSPAELRDLVALSAAEIAGKYKMKKVG
jgi:predicted DNA-binding transcriptional regulator YafY